MLMKTKTILTTLALCTFALCGSTSAVAQKKAKPRPNAVYELKNDMPVFLDQLKEELTYPLAWENSGMRFKK